MNDVPVIAYHPEYARLPDKKARTIGHSAALMLSQFGYLQGTRPLSSGWIECSQEEITGWGFTRTEQETCRRKLIEAGYIQERRSGSRGTMQFLVCWKPAIWTNQNAENLQSKPVLGKSECGKPTLQNAENLHSETPLFPIKCIKTKDKKYMLDESSDFVSFYDSYLRKVARPKAWIAWKKLNPTPETVAKIMQALKALLPEWKQMDPKFIPHPATWITQRRWEDEGASLTSAKDSTVAKNGTEAAPLYRKSVDDRPEGKPFAAPMPPELKQLRQKLFHSTGDATP